MANLTIEKGRKISKFPWLSSHLTKDCSNSKWLPKVIPGDGVYPTSSARTGLYYAWKAIDLPAGAKILTPSFICNSVSKPLIEAGAVIKYFSILPDLQYDWNELKSIDLSNVKVFLWVHYLGLTNDFNKVLKFCKENNLYLIEDCAHALLSTYEEKPVGSFGDIAVYSLRKTIPTLCGGAIKVNNKKFICPKSYSDKVKSYENATKKEYDLLCYSGFLKSLRLWRQQKSGNKLMPKESNLEMILSDKEFPYILDGVSQQVVQNIDLIKVKQKLRLNFEIYQKHLIQFSPVKMIGAGDAPTGFPVIVVNRNKFRINLENKGIYSICHWPEYMLPKGVRDDFPETLKLANSILTLPCHQDLSVSDVEYVCTEVKKLLLEKE